MNRFPPSSSSSNSISSPFPVRSSTTRPSTANPSTSRSTPFDSSTFPSRPRTTKLTRPRTAPSNLSCDTRYDSDTLGSRPLHFSAVPQTSKPLPSPSNVALAAELSSFRMRPLPDSPVSATFPSGPSLSRTDPISPLDTSYASYPLPPLPLRPRKTAAYDSSPTSSSSDDETAARNALRAGSAIANYNYFEIDFSFLEDEPPAQSSKIISPNSTTRSHRKLPSTSTSSTDDSAEDDLMKERRMKQVFPPPSRRTESATSRPTSHLPFPSRPTSSRQVSAESTATRKSLSSSIRSGRENRPRLPTGLTSTFSAGNRLSLASFVSSELSPGEQPRRPSLSFPSRPSGYFDFPDRRKQLATFLDETAEAMEGGKSLNMVLPTAPHDRPLSQFVEPASPTDRNYLFPSNDSHSRHRDTVYYTPRAEEHSPADESNDSLVQDLSSHLATSEVGGTGLGLGVETSPVTLRAPSPGRFPSSRSGSQDRRGPEVTNENSVKKEKLAERRRRTIKELVDTERTYAADMMVVRDIYLARARGAHMTQIADHVMSTGLGLGGLDAGRPVSPVSPTSATFAKASSAPRSARRSTSGASIGRSDSVSRSSFASTSQPNLVAGQPIMSSKDIHIIFANLEEIASLAEAFAGLLDHAAGGDEEEMEDRIGETFLEVLPRIQQVYSNYCVRHHRAIVRLQDLEPTLRSYFSECKTLSHGRTNAWDLASLLIKPVQRCLKYPLLLDQILSATPEDHPDRDALQRANTDILVVADAINESKKRSETVARIVSKDKSGQRRDSAKSISSMGTTMTKKLLRTSQKAKGIFGANGDGGDEIFDTLVALVDSTRSGVLRFSNEMRDWTRCTKGALEAQVTMVEGWIDLYAPLGGEKPVGGGPHHRLCVFLDNVLIPVIEGPWRELDQEVKRSLILKTDHLLSLFDNPRQVIAKRNDKLLDHQRYLAKKLPSDRKGSEDFIILSTQLLEELPRFLGSVSRYFNIIVAHFAAAQASYHAALEQRWADFTQQWLTRSPGGTLRDSIETLHSTTHQPIAQMMDSLAAGLGIALAQASVSSHRKSGSRLSRPTSSASTTKTIPSPLDGSSSSDYRSTTRQSYFSDCATDYTSDRAAQRDSFTTSHRSSATSMSSLPSSNDPVTPPPLVPGHYSAPQLSESCKRPPSMATSETFGSYDRRSIGLRCEAPLPSVPTQVDSPEQQTLTIPLPPRRSSVDIQCPSTTSRPVFGRSTSSQKPLSDYSVSGYEGIDGEDFLEREGPLYVAEAISASKSTAYRAGYPILSFDIGERLQVELEEADRAEGGSGWLLGRKVAGNGRLGWVRTEDFAMIEEEDEEGF